jgi:hypothetical protein
VAARGVLRGVREQPNKTPIPRDVSGKGSVYPPESGGIMAKPMPQTLGPVKDAMQRNFGPRFIARPTPQAGAVNRQPPEMQRFDPSGGGAMSRSFPSMSGPIRMEPDRPDGFLPPRLQKQVDAGAMTQEGATNRFQAFQQGQLPGQQGQAETLGAIHRMPQQGGDGGSAMSGFNVQGRDQGITAEEAATMQQGGPQPMGGMSFGAQAMAPGMGVQMQNPAFREQLKQMLQQRMGGGASGGPAPRFMA